MQPTTALRALEPLFRGLDPQTTVVTATRRLARWLEHAHASWQQLQGARTWERPELLPWSRWIALLWDEARFEDERLPRRLGAAEELALWEQVVERHSPEGLLSSDGAARNAQRAREAMLLWRLPRAQIRGFAGEDTHIFLQWERAYRRRLRRRGWVDAAELPARLARGLPPAVRSRPRRVLLLGFDRFPPADRDLLDALRVAGWRIETPELADPPDPPGDHRLVRAPDPGDEERRAALWIRERLARMPEGAQVGLIVPDLDGRRDGLERTLDEVLSPLGAAPWEDAGERPWHVSLGRPLADYPLPHDALALLRVAEGFPQPLSAWGILLRSPYLAGAEAELYVRAAADARLRRTGEPEVGIGEVIAALDGGGRRTSLGARLRRLAAEAAAAGGMATPAGWAERFGNELGAMGWPGERRLDSMEYQSLDAFRELLTEFSTLGSVHPRLSRGAALGLLQRLAGRKGFQPAGNEAAPVQVMDVAEAAGLRFDALCVLGMDDEVWPGPVRPVPLIPAAVQQRHCMPGAHPAESLEQAERTTRRLRAAAPAGRWFCAERDGDRELRVSPLLQGWPRAPEGTGGRPLTWPQRIQAAGRLEDLDDSRGLPLPEGTVMGGGAGFFRDQAACPFRGYALHRLGAGPLQASRLGLGPRERGSLLHRVMEGVWRRLGGRSALDATTPGMLQETVLEEIDRAVTDAARGRERTFSERFVALERARLLRLVEEWLTVERRRKPFEVAETEAERMLEIGGLVFRMRLDRVDRLPHGGEVIVDYKTGHASVRALGGEERPDDLQLALYALEAESRIEGVVYAQVRAGDCRYVGVADDPESVPGARTPRSLLPEAADGEWDALVDRWRDAAHALAAEARAGAAGVTPKAKACQSCPLPGLCRVNEYVLMGERGRDG